MQGRSGISINTPDRLLLDAGEAFFNIDLTLLEGTGGVAGALEAGTSVGATRGGSTFSAQRSLREMPADGMLGPVRGMIRRQRVAPVLTLNMLEMTVANLSRFIAGLVTTETGTEVGDPDPMTKLTGGEITAAAFMANVALIATYSGSTTPVLIVVKNAIVMDPPDLSMQGEDEAVFTVPFMGTFDPADYTEEPWAIYHPEVLPVV